MAHLRRSQSNGNSSRHEQVNMQERIQPPMRGYGCGTTYDEEGEQRRARQGESSGHDYVPSRPGEHIHDGAARTGGSRDGAAETQRALAQVDERIRRQVCQALSDAPDLDASAVEVTVNEREVTLEGSVQDQRAKFEAEDRSAGVFAVRAVRNQLRTEKTVIGDVGALLGADASEPRIQKDHAGLGPQSRTRSTSNDHSKRD